MARTRNIKPDFFKNEVLAEIDPLGRLLFAGLWTIADREGRLEDRPRRIKAELLPYDECDCNRLLNDLAEHGFIIRYCVDGSSYIVIPTFTKHQQPHIKEAESTIPAPDLTGTSTVLVPCEAPTEHDTSRPSSLNPHPSSLILDSGVSGAEAPTPPPIKKTRRTSPAITLPPDYEITPDMLAWAGTKAKEYGVILNARLLAEKFITYYRFGQGRDKPQKEWGAVWQQWVLKEIGNGGDHGKAATSEPVRLDPAEANRRFEEARARKIAALAHNSGARAEG